MKLLIDNADGLGPIDYTEAVVSTGPTTITRKLGDVTLCTALLDVQGSGLAVPSSRARVLAQSDGEAVLFAGYVVSAIASVENAGAPGGKFAVIRMEAAEDSWVTHAPAVSGLQPAGSKTHTIALAETPVSWKPASGSWLREIASDVTLSGEHEPATYVTELFRGDGSTAAFALASAPFHTTGRATVLQDDFASQSFDPRLWSLVDPGRFLSVGAGGLTASGGNGLDGQTMLQFVSAVEMGGALLLQASGVVLQPGSEGVLMGLYGRAVLRGNCFAGIHVKGAAGAQTLTALVNGVEVGTPFAFAPGHSYTLRVRLFCAERQRVMGSYQALVQGAVQTFGGGLVNAPAHVVFEVVDEGLASNTVATVLFDGAVSASPAQCAFVPLNSAEMQCSIGAMLVQQTGPMRVVSTRSDGTKYTRREGAAGEGADFSLSTKGMLTFFPGMVPQPGELLMVCYRRSSRSVARVQDAAASALEQQVGLPGLPTWSAHVEKPLARSSSDCLAAAQALLLLGGDASTLLQGHCDLYDAQQDADVLPGDILAIHDGTVVRALPVWSVTVADGNCAPEVMRYRVEFAQDERHCLSFRVGGAVALDAPLSLQPFAGTSATAPSLPDLQVVSATATALQVDAGADPLGGGGFEVRSVDGAFAPGSGVGLVLRSPVRGFSIPRAAFRERFFIRMYDGATPPRYSQWSSAVLTHLPVA